MAKFLKVDKKKRNKYFLWTAGGILIILLAVMPIIAANQKDAGKESAAILQGTVEKMDIETNIIGGGQLASEASVNIRIPENVKLTQYLVGNGDTVKEGQPIAKVDRVSVMTAITEVQKTLDYLDERITASSDDTASTSVKALSGGTVKVIYAQEGESVQDVMLRSGALAILSLDDTMAVKIEKETNLDVGDTVCVTFSDGTQVDGRVKTNLEGVLTITMEDDDYCVGAKVTVSTEAGEELGTGELYIFSAWSATAYSGRICDVLVEENDSVYIGQSMFTLEDTGNSAQFQRLIDQRQEYEELMQELFTMYRTETIIAPCDGIVTGVDKDGAYLLSDSGDGWFVSLLSFFGPEKDGFVAHAVTVTEVTASGTQLRIDPKAMYLEDLAAASRLYANVNDTTEIWNCPGEIAVYAQDENGLLHSDGTAEAGDILLAIGDEEQVLWFVRLDGGNKTAQAAQTENQNHGIAVFLLSDSDVQENICTGDENCTADSHNEGCPKIFVLPVVCTGDDSCTADTHSDSGPMKNTPVDGENDNITFLGEDGTGDDGGEARQSCTGEADCTFEPHNENCKSQITTDPEPQQPTVQITTTQLPSGIVGIGYSATLQASGSGTWTAVGLPTGLTLDGSTGAITGTPTSAGSYSVTVTFTYGENQTVTATFPLTIEAATSDEPEDEPVIQITTTTLGTGVVGQSYTYPMQVSGSTAGTWSAVNLPSGLVMNEQTGVISGTPTYEGTFAVTITYTDTATQISVPQDYTLTIVTAETVVYTGYVAQVVEIEDGWAKVKQTLYSYTIADLSEPPKVSASAADLTVEREYTSERIKTSELAVGDTFLIVVNNKGTVKLVSKDAIQKSQGTPGQTGMNTGGTPSDGMSAGGGTTSGMAGGMGQLQTFETYSLDKLTVASVTSQEHMTVSITVDELDITKIYVGQAAVVSVDALGGEHFDAVVAAISNSGENEGGNSKFTVALTLGKSGDMLPGMLSTAYISSGTSTDVPSVRVAALEKDGSETIVYTSYDEEKRELGDPVTVTLGKSDGENVEIIDGLNVGAVYYYAYYETLTQTENLPSGNVSFGLPGIK